MNRFALPVSIPRLASYLVVIGLVGAVGVHQLNYSSAATTYSHNPTAIADYCRIVNGSTTLFGWGYDPDAAAGSQPYVSVTVAGVTTKVATNITNYRNSAINTYIGNHYPGAPTPTPYEYGWKLSLGTLYKGTSYAVSGTGLNYGTGSNSTLSVHSGSPVDGNAANIAFTSSKTIPDACLTTKPAPPPPPTPTPPPPTTGGGSSGGGSGSGSGSKSSGSTKKTTTPSAPAPSGDANGTVKAGTTSAVITIPAGNAAKVHITYVPADGIAIDTGDQDVSGDNATVTLTDLEASTDYTYQIIRTNSAGTSATSASAPFTTSGYTVSLHFTDSKNKPVSGIKGTIDNTSNTTATSDKTGVMKFTDLSSGAYTVSYTYKSTKHEADFDTESASGDQLNADGSPANITLSDTIDVDKFTDTSSNKPASKGGSSGAVWLVIIIVLLTAGAIWWLLRWRHKRKLLAEYATVGLPAANTNAGMPAPLPPAAPQPTGPLPAHAGESLRDMVIESMRSAAPPKPEEPDPLEPLPPSTPIADTARPLEPYESNPLPPPAVTANEAPTIEPYEPAQRPETAETEKPKNTHHAKPEAAHHKKSDDDTTTLQIHHDKK